MSLFISTIFGIISMASGTLILISPQINVTIEMDDAEASFGAPISDESPLGKISTSDPPLACSAVQSPPNETDVFFALVDRGNCTFAEKVSAVQNAKYFGAIIVNVESDYVFPMGSDEKLVVTIPSIMVGRTSGEAIRNHYLYNSGFRARMKPNRGTTIEYYLVPLLIALSLAFLAIIISLAVRVFRNCMRQSKNRLSREILNKLPEIRFSEDYQNLYETCAICLEDYTMGDKLRVLPCHHAYHSKCVDRWLLRRQGSCPVCKYRIHRNHDDLETDNEENRTDGGGDYEDVANEGGVESANAQNVATGTSAIGVLQTAYSVPLNNTDAASGDFDADYDENDGVAPLLSRSAPVVSWLSGGLLPSRGTTWLGNDNPAFETTYEGEESAPPSVAEGDHSATVSFRTSKCSLLQPSANKKSEGKALETHQSSPNA
ncbi:e3 ubiquitin protein ligase RNF13 [Echinococcus multilocularis]|uniref:E3 ubiquitin protein ligase RNF13 n=1 Tax=Echinococcus multilocularis TaxID=6211 RepID=A0A087W214_ECHMU|nr:e3 ubiquitin protein ligase RNF13 [Echinococcus multilocularis]